MMKLLRCASGLSEMVGALVIYRVLYGFSNYKYM